MKYVKPDLYVEEFELNTNIAACNRLPTEDYEYKATLIECVASKSDMIFTVDTSGCDHDVVPNNAGNGYMWVTYRNQLYFCWISKERDSANQSSLNTLNNILRAGGVNNWDAGNGYVWHAGPANDYMTQLWSHSY